MTQTSFEPGTSRSRVLRSAAAPHWLAVICHKIYAICRITCITCCILYVTCREMIRMLYVTCRVMIRILCVTCRVMLRMLCVTCRREPDMPRRIDMARNQKIVPVTTIPDNIIARLTNGYRRTIRQTHCEYNCLYGQLV